MTCKLAGTLALTPNLIVSINVSANADVSYLDGQLITGPTIGTVNIVGYADTNIYVGEMGRAGVSIEWARKYDCDNDIVYLLFSGAKGYITGGASAYASLVESVASVNSINASVASGPSVPYDDSNISIGMGLNYNGSPVSISVSNTGPPSVVSIGGMSDLYLQNFSLECNPGQVPMANYSFVFVEGDVVAG